MEGVRAKRDLFEKELREHGVEHRKLWQDFQRAEDDHVDQGTISTSFMREFRIRLQKMEEDFGKTVADATVVLDASEELWMLRG